MARTTDDEPGGFETGSELRRDAPPPEPTDSEPEAPRSSGRVWAAVLAILVVGLLVYLLFTLL